MSDVHSDPRRDLIARTVLGELTPAEATTLTALCRADPAVAEELARQLESERLLTLSYQPAEPGLFAAEVVQRLSAGDRAAERAAVGVMHRIHRRQWTRRLFALAATALVAFALTWVITLLRPSARVLRVESASWSGPELQAGQALRGGGRVVLEQGMVELRFPRGSRVLLEGPVDFEVRGRSAGFLHRGRAVADVPDTDHGFIIDSPRGRVVDLGTAFGISVDDSGSTEVHVIEGRVRAGITGDTRMQEIGVDEALRLAAEGTTRMAANPAAFLTEMPPVASASPNFLHWRFNEGAGFQSADSGRGLGDANTLLELKSYRRGQATPQWTAGPFGTALSFNGTGAYAETAYRGIEGGQARTVAAWVRVPADFGRRDGFGILSWGNYSSEGAAWQLSINPLEEEGDMGRLRLGTNRGYVIGTTDLRDGQWHHVAAVLYGGARPNTGTHVLLYVDGRLEPASTKALRDIHTAIDPDAHGIWVGRNLAFNDRHYTGGPFFRGSLDEILIADSAFSQEQIQRLMREGGL
jgi:Concanavalin A-like lectin/glucanases superfamily/FecR protein